MDLQELLHKASDLKKSGNRVDAFKMYSEAFDVLVKEANTYAGSFENTGHESIEDGQKVWTDTPAFFEKAEEYMKRDKTAAIITNSMGVILAELGDAEGAKKWFEQAVELTPDRVDYPDPIINLKNVTDKQDDKINIQDFAESFRRDFMSTKKRISDLGDGKEHYCETCKRKIEDEALVAIDKEFCSDVCYLHYWKEERPNFGGNWISETMIEELDKLTGRERESQYVEITNFIRDHMMDTNVFFGLRMLEPKDDDE